AGEQCGGEVGRIPEVADAWLDAGIVPFSTRGWQNDKWVEHGYATGASAGLSGADLPDHAYWEKWFPADWVSEMREQIRLWFYSQSFMSVTLTGCSPYRRLLTYEKVFDERGKPMHKSTGNAIELDEALDRMGADVMRWLYCAQALLGRRRDGDAGPLARPGAGAPRDLPSHAFPGRAPLADPGRTAAIGRAGLGLPRRLAGAEGAGPYRVGRDERGAPRGRDGREGAR